MLQRNTGCNKNVSPDWRRRLVCPSSIEVSLSSINDSSLLPPCMFHLVNRIFPKYPTKEGVLLKEHSYEHHAKRVKKWVWSAAIHFSVCTLCMKEGEQPQDSQTAGWWLTFQPFFFFFCCFHFYSIKFIGLYKELLRIKLFFDKNKKKEKKHGISCNNFLQYNFQVTQATGSPGFEIYGVKSRCQSRSLNF